tara:strand:+ start:80 stop:196 length:117 start_codon:yes stop_codon:yes gene_type:complete
MKLLFLILLLACGDDEDSAADTGDQTEETDTEVYIRYH